MCFLLERSSPHCSLRLLTSEASAPTENQDHLRVGVGCFWAVQAGLASTSCLAVPAGACLSVALAGPGGHMPALHPWGRWISAQSGDIHGEAEDSFQFD